MHKCDKCKYPYDIRKWPCVDCLQGDRFEQKPFTNADRIRAMTDEELATRFATFDEWTQEAPANSNYEVVYRLWLDWLKQGVEDGL